MYVTRKNNFSPAMQAYLTTTAHTKNQCILQRPLITLSHYWVLYLHHCLYFHQHLLTQTNKLYQTKDHPQNQHPSVYSSARMYWFPWTLNIYTYNQVPIKQRPYCMSPAKQSVMKKLEEILNVGIVEPSHSGWASPVVLDPKRRQPQILLTIKSSMQSQGMMLMLGAHQKTKR